MHHTMAAILILLGCFTFQQQITFVQAQHNIDPIRQRRNLRQANQDEGILLHGNHDDLSKMIVNQNRNLYQCTDFGLEIQFDDYAHEVYWGLESDTQYFPGVSYGRYYNSSYNNAIVSEHECIPPGSYKFTIFDDGDDGLCCAFGQGHYRYSLNQVWIHQGGQYGSEEVTSFDVVVSPTVSPSPTFGPWPTAAPSLAPTILCTSNEVTLGVEIQHDYSPWEISWNLTNSLDALVVSEGEFSYEMPYARSYREYCIAHGAYTFTIYSSFEYGLYGGFYKVSIDGEPVGQGETFYVSEETKFATPEATLWPTVSPQPSASSTVSPQPTSVWTTIVPTWSWTWTPTSSPTSAPTVECASNEVTFVLDIKQVFHSYATSWDLMDSSGNVLLLGQGSTSGYWIVHKELCLLAGSYLFTIYNTEGEEYCQNDCPGYYKLWMDGEVVKKGEVYHFQESTAIVAVPSSNP